MACDLYTKKLSDLYSNYFEESLMFETSQDCFNYLVQLLRKLKEELSDLSEDEFKGVLQEGYDDSLRGDSDLIEAKNAIIQEIKNNFPAESQRFFTEGNMVLLFRDATNNTPVTEDNAENNNEKTLTVSLETVLDLGKEFLFTYFKDSTDMSDDFEKIAKSYLVKSFLVDYEGGFIVERSQLNDQIRQTQQHLVNQIVEYLKLVDGKSQKGVWIDFQGKNFRISELETTNVFHEDHTSTGLYEALLPLIKLHLNVQGMSTSMLNDIHQNKHKEPVYYNAVMAVTLLDNFNNYLKSVFGEKNLDIQNVHQKLNFIDSYFFSEKGDGNITTYRVDENPDVVKETNSITKLIFETVPYYTFNSNEPVPGQYLNFPQASRVIADLKTLGKNSRFKDAARFGKIKERIGTFSSDTLEVLTESDIQSVADIIAKIRHNPLKYFSALLELLCDSYINTEVLKLDLNQHVLNIMYSMYRTLFSNKHNSLRRFSKNYHRLYPQITLFIDTVYKVELVQYNTDEDGITHAYLLAENEVNNQKNYLDQSIYQFNARGTGSYAVHQSKYNILASIDKDNNLSHITFTIPDTNYQIKVDRAGKVKIFENGKLVKNLDLTQQNKFRWFIESMLHISVGSVGHDSDFFKALKSILKTVHADTTGAKQMNLMFEMAARVLLYQYVNANIDGKDIKHFLIEDARPNTHRIFKDELMMISKADFKEIVPLMAEAMCIVNGNVTASQVKNGEGKAQGLTTLSRLMNSKNSQWLLQNKQEGSAVKEFSLYDLIEDVYVTVEKHDLSSTKPVNKFGVAEGIYSQFVLDFISGLVDHSTDRNVFGNGKIGVLGSVNSDKTTVAKLVLNLSKQEVTWRDAKGKVKSKKLIQNNKINISNEEFVELINYELGNYYYKHMKNILSDWVTLLTYLGVEVSPNASINALLNEFNTLYSERQFENETQLEYLSRVVADYNLNSGNFLEFIDQIHYIETKQGFTFNKTTESLLCRFRPNAASEFDLDLSAYLSSDEFWLELDFNMFKSLFESDFQLKLINTKNVKNATNLTNTTKADGTVIEGKGAVGSLEHDYLLADSGWVRLSTKEFIYAKVYIPGESKSQNITSSLTANRVAKKLRNYLFDLLRANPEFLVFVNGNRVYNFSELSTSDLLRVTTADGKYIFKLDLNNLLRLYNYLDYLFSQEYLISTVGSHIAHPDKNKIDIPNNTKLDILSEESARFNALHKRNVSQTATMKEYQLNDIFGVSTDMNVAIVKDIIDFQNTVNGDTDRIKPYDGACIVNPFMVLLENYSLGADAAGYVKKPFFHAFKERFGTGIIIKTAGFGITNDNLRNLLGTKILMKKMTNRRWRDHNGNVITEYNVFDSKIPGGTFSGNSYDKIFYMKDGVIYQRSIEYVSGMNYKITDYQLNELGEVVSESSFEQIIDTNYKLWNAFGGEFSCHYDNKKGAYIYDESSIEAVVEIMNSTGYVLNPKGEIRYQEDFYQPLKHADIHYLATEGAIKQGASNINSAKVYATSTLESNDYDDLSLSYMKVKLYQAGIQLDKEHHADKAELSLMTLVISACALKGFTISEALHLYQALSSIGEALLSDFYKIVKDYVTLEKDASEEEKLTLTDKIRGLLYDTLLSTLSKLEVDLNNIASAMAYKIIQNYRKNKSMTLEEKLLPISDTTMFKKLVSNLAVYLSNKGIKVKVQGILAILNPSYDLFKLYNGKKLEEYSDSRTFVATEGLLKSWMSTFRGELNPAVTYETVEIRATKTSSDYFQIEKDEANGTYNLYRSFGLSSDEFSELLVGVALYLPVNSLISSFTNEEALTKLLQLGFEKVGTRTLENNKLVPILKKVKSLPKELLLEQLKAPKIKASQVRLGNSYYITRRVIGLNGVENFITDKQSIISIADYKNLSKETDIISIRHNYTDGSNLSAYNIVYQAESPEGKSVNLGLYDSDAIYWQNEFKQSVRKCPFSSKKLQDYLKYRLNLKKSDLDRVSFLNRVINGENFANELAYYNLIRQFIEIDETVFGGLYFNGKTIRDFVVNNSYVDIRALNTFVLARLSRIVQHNLSALSETRERIEVDFEKDYAIYNNVKTSEENKTEIYKYWRRYAEGVLKERFNSDVTPAEVFAKMQQYITNTTSILVNGVLYKVNPDTVQILAHLCVMPKTMATKYGLEIHDNLSTIKNDVGFFYKRFKQKYRRLLTDDKDFTLELKRLNGDHVYLITQDDLAKSGLKEKSDVHFNYIDGKLWRVDNLGHRLYLVSSENDKVYVNEATGVEVIKTDDMTFYLNNLDYQNIEISRASSWDPNTGEVSVPEGSEQRIDEVIEAIKASSNKIAKRVYKYYKDVGIEDDIDEDSEEESEVTHQQVAVGNRERSSMDENFTDKSDDEVILDYLNGNRDYIPDFVQRMIRNTLEIHSSFLLSLNILAARIPALCMQSFMAMEVVAFNNSDTSNAYVATSQIYLQGSDFDIDAVSLETFSFDANGRFYDWSPYFSLLTSRDLNRSLRISFPTFKEVTLKEKADASVIKELIDNGFIKVEEVNETVKFKIKDIKNLNKILSITELPTSLTLYSSDSLNKLVLDKVKNFVDRHNMYFALKSAKQIEGASANYAMYNSYKIAADPANQILAMTSVDSTTRPMKIEGDKSKKAKALANRGPGNWINKIEAINENSVGKDCIAICATGIKVFTAATFTNNYILNEMPDLQEYLLFEVKSERDEKGEKINITHQLLANIKAKNPNTVTNEEVYELLLSVNDDVDAALVLSALLSLSTDNAKELQLSKLNATAEMIGMYIYGISIGMDFRDLARTLMSDTGELIMKLRSSDSFNDTPTFYNFYSIFEHLEMDPNLNAYSYRVRGIRSPKSFLDEFLLNEAEKLYKQSKSKDKNMTLVEYLFRHKGVTENGVTRAYNVYDLKEAISKTMFGEKGRITNIVENSEGALTQSDYEAFKIIWNQMFEYLAEWHEQHKAVAGYTFVKEAGVNMYINSPTFMALDSEVQEKYKKYLNYDYLKIKRLAEGASEMKIAGLMLGINKGFKSTIDDLIALQSVISKAFNDRNLWKTLKGNLYSFSQHVQQTPEDPFLKNYARKYKNSNILRELVFDESKKNSIIEEYDKIKHTFNLPLILTTQPNYHEYYKALVTTDVLLSSGSFLYKALTELVTDLSLDLKVYSATEISNIRKGIEKYVMHKIINNFLNTDRTQNGGQLTFEIPTNSAYVSNTGATVVNKGGSLSFKTGNDATNYTFKMFMELVVMPRLLRGELTPGSRYFFLEDNPFVANLVPVINDRTYTKVPTMLMTSNINLLPTNPEEDTLFKLYKAAFKEIAQQMFSSGNIHSNSIADLFFVYDLFVNNNTLSQNSFKKLFVSPVEIVSQLQTNFYNYVNNLDKTIKTREELLSTIFGSESLLEVYNELLPYILKPYAGNTEFANSPYLIVQSEDGSIIIKRKADSGENAQINEQMGDEGITSEKYETMAIDRHLTPVTFYGMDIESGVFKTASYNEGSVLFKYRVVSLTKEVNRVEIDIDGKIYNVEVPVKKSSKGTDKLDLTYLIGLVENIVNPC